MKKGIEKTFFFILLSILLVFGVLFVSTIAQNNATAMSAGDVICWTGASCYHIGQKCNDSCDCNWIGMCKYKY